MRLERSANTKRNIIVGEADKLIGILLPFVVRTMIIHLIGADYLGLMGLFYSIVQMLNLVELGFGTAVVYSMYKPIAENDEKTMNALMLFYKKVYRYMGYAVSVIGLVLMLFLRFFIKGGVPEHINVYLLYMIFLTNTCINYFLYPNRKALITAYQRDDLSGKMHIITQLAMYGFQMLAVYFAKDFYLYALTIPISTVAYNLLCAREAKRVFPQYVEEGSLQEEQYQEIKKQVFGLMVRKLATLSRNAFDSMFVSAVLGLSITAIYGNYYYIMDAVVMLLAVVKTAMAGGVGNSIAMESVDKNLRDMNSINFLYMLIGGWCSICLLCLYQPFMKIWVGESMMFPMNLALMFSLYFYILKMGDIRTLYAEAVGIWWEARYLSVAEAVCNLVLNYLLIHLLGVFGIVLATMISYLIFNFYGGAVILFRHYFEKKSFNRYLLSNLLYAVVTIFIGAITFLAVSFITWDGILGLLVKGIICALVPGVLYFLVYCKTKEFQNAVPFLKAMLRQKG